jgi:hypothetical protein
VGDALSPWEYATWSYVAFALLTLWWPLSAALRGVKLNPGGSSFSESDWFSDQAKKYLVEHHGRLQGTLGFWKKQAETYRRFHYYVLLWTIPVSALILVLTQSISDDRWSRVLLTIASAHVAVLLAMHKAFKVDATWRGYRHGESEFYDTYRRLLDRPRTFGATETEHSTPTSTTSRISASSRATPKPTTCRPWSEPSNSSGAIVLHRTTIARDD